MVNKGLHFTKTHTILLFSGSSIIHDCTRWTSDYEAAARAGIGIDMRASLRGLFEQKHVSFDSKFSFSRARARRPPCSLLHDVRIVYNDGLLSVIVFVLFVRRYTHFGLSPAKLSSNNSIRFGTGIRHTDTCILLECLLREMSRSCE